MFHDHRNRKRPIRLTYDEDGNQGEINDNIELLDESDDEEFDEDDLDAGFIISLRNAIKNTVEEYVINDDNFDNEDEKMKLKEAKEKLIDSRPNKKYIVQANMSIEDTVKALEELEIINDPQINSIDRLNVKRKLIKFVDSNKNNELLKRRCVEFEKQLPKKESMLSKIINCNQSLHNKKIIYDHYQEYSNELCSKGNTWLKIALNLPTKSYIFPIESINLLSEAKNKLNQEIYKMTYVKKEIIKLLYNKMRGINTNRFLTLVGPPGTGKTSILQLACEVIDIPFHKINLGGMECVSILNGHSYTYEGSMPGLIVNNIIHDEYNNCIFFFDEIDKISNSTKGLEVQSCLLHILDGTQNKTYQDKYLKGMHVDLSNCTFVLSANNLENIPGPLRDRLDIVEVNGYEYTDKINILKDYLWPKYCNKYNIYPELTNTLSKKLVSINHTNKSGIRQLERDTENLINTLCIAKDNSDCAGFIWNDGDPITINMLESIVKKKNTDLIYSQIFI